MTAAGTPGSSATSPTPLIPSPVDGYQVLGAGASHRHLAYQQQQQKQQHQQHQPSLAFIHQHPPIPYHGASITGGTTAPGASAPVSGFPTDPPPFLVGSGVTPSGPRPLLPGRASSGAKSDVSPQNAEQDQFLIPYEHSTAANTLLSLPLVQCVLEQRQEHAGSRKRNRNEAEARRAGARIRGGGRGGGRASTISGAAAAMSTATRPLHSFAYPRTYFYDIETRHPLPTQLELINGNGPGLAQAILPSKLLADIHPTMLEKLAQSYFAHVHPAAPLFSIAQFRQWSSKVYEQDADKNIETAICLAVWTLGSLASPPPAGMDASLSLSPKSSTDAAQKEQIRGRESFALSLFQPAFKIIIHYALWEFDAAPLAICQALLLAASFFSHIGRPLHNARMVHMASRLLIRLIEE